jgi:hypothetical protein
MNEEAEIYAQAAVLWSHLPADLRPPDGADDMEAILDSGGKVLIQRGDRWFSLHDKDTAWTWTAPHPNPGAIEVVAYQHGWESARDIVSM